MASSTVIAWRPLGEMLVERGLLTVPQLEDALHEQEQTGERLGAILVARKIVAGAVLTTILAKQVGVELETQGGFGSGLFSKIARRNGRVEPVADVLNETMPADPGVADASAEPPIAFVDELLAQLGELRGQLEIERARRLQLEAELAVVRAKPKTPARRAGVKPTTPKRTPAAKRTPPTAKRSPAPKPPASKAKPKASRASATKPRTTKPKRAAGGARHM